MPLDIGEGVLYEASTTGSGTGNYDSFLRIAANSNEIGFNTNDGGEANNKDGIWTHTLLLSGLDTVFIGPLEYYEIRLDLNEVQSGDKHFITLEDLRIYGSTIGADGPAFTANFPNISFDKVFDLDANGDTSLLLDDSNHGSGTDDYVFYIPTTLFDAGSTFLTLLARFSGSDDGFEEFRVKTQEFVPQPDIGVLKETNGTDDTCPDVIAGSTVTWTYTVENNGNVPLENVVVTDDAGTPGIPGDDFNPTPTLVGGFNVGDTNQDNVLDTDETWIYTATGNAIVGEYANVATVSGVYDDDTLSGQTVSAIEEDCYNGVTPTIAVEKLTNGTDGTCPYILVGKDVVWTYNVTNTSLGAITIDTIVITDDAGTPLLLGDDFHPAPVLSGLFNAGDTNTNNLLDVDETWQYAFTAPAGAVSGEYENTATVNATAHDSSGNTAPVTGSAEDCYFGADPDIDIVKMTNGTNDLCPVVSVGSTVTWTYAVTNTGNVALSNLVISDDNGTPGALPADTADDFAPTAVLSGAFNVGDANTDGIFDPGETWQYSATGVALEGHYDNIATVSGEFTDDFEHSAIVTATEDDCYVGVEGPGVRTPGFWANWGDFWDGDYSVPKQAGTDCFASYDLLRIDSNGDGTIDSNDAGFSKNGGTLGVFIGDYDRDGVQDAGEDIIFISLSDAQSLINAKNNQMSDGVIKIGRDVVATWLNYLAGNPIGDASDTGSPHHFIDDAVDYLQIFGDSNNANPGGFQNTNDTFDVYSSSHKKVDTSSSFWTQNFPGGDHSGAQIHGALDEYNNTGGINGVGYAHSCDTQQFVTLMSGFMVHDGLFVM